MLKSGLKSCLKSEIRNPKQYFLVIPVKYVNLYHVNYNVRHPASWHSSLPGELVVHYLSVTRGITTLQKQWCRDDTKMMLTVVLW